MKGLTDKQILQLLTIAKNTQRGVGLDELAFVSLMRICRDYVDRGCYPAIRGEQRDRWFMDRLNKYRIRFFEKM